MEETVKWTNLTQQEIAHYPPYTSKYNPIEHLLFSHVTRRQVSQEFKPTMKIVFERYLPQGNYVAKPQPA